ncbi:Piso0_004435 [Millerozyma farinosa CBS 7064]|uniref:Piso0_004435 protein n=1 Tax=Pichia sorbitophila (strain ATCC MYA-4447 / BCRC 22081 / CBS 7064 / NBRC 10061 / NRRL Y-12695) TaxID=559304 RepID=G8Y5G5_PICSO|nr:Piso0_004435 [Millerozyma farinosa CBS 7064]CCE84876.1 Piso0_004435 [Millerozyma farinosa CBS 7064]
MLAGPHRRWAWGTSRPRDIPCNMSVWSFVLAPTNAFICKYMSADCPTQTQGTGAPWQCACAEKAVQESLSHRHLFQKTHDFRANSSFLLAQHLR